MGSTNPTERDSESKDQRRYVMIETTVNDLSGVEADSEVDCKVDGFHSANGFQPCLYIS